MFSSLFYFMLVVVSCSVFYSTFVIIVKSCYFCTLDGSLFQSTFFPFILFQIGGINILAAKEDTKKLHVVIWERFFFVLLLNFYSKSVYKETPLLNWSLKLLQIWITKDSCLWCFISYSRVFMQSFKIVETKLPLFSKFLWKMHKF